MLNTVSPALLLDLLVAHFVVLHPFHFVKRSMGRGAVSQILHAKWKINHTRKQLINGCRCFYNKSPKRHKQTWKSWLYDSWFEE